MTGEGGDYLREVRRRAGRIPMSSADRPLYGVDAGGSGTFARAWDGQRWNGPSVNPSSAAQASADAGLRQLFAWISGHVRRGREHDRGPARPAIWLASASVDQATAAGETRRCARMALQFRLDAELVVSNDVTPLLLCAPPEAGHVVTVCGTGTAFLATDGRSAPVRVGGCEYLGSDEGSAFDLGLQGLRAAVRGLDGRGQPTALSGLLAEEAGVPVPELARRLAGAPFPKAAVARLAPAVLRAWLDGDQVAAGLAGAAIGELAAGVRAARDAAALSPGWRLSVVGGVMTGCPQFFRRLAEAVADMGGGPVILIDDPAAAVLRALMPLAAADPLRLADPRIERDTWYVDVAGRAGTPGRSRRDA